MEIPDKHAEFLSHVLLCHLNDLWREYEDNKDNPEYFDDQAHMTPDQFRDMIEKQEPVFHELIDICGKVLNDTVCKLE